MPSRGDAISGYSAPFSKGAKAYLTNLKYVIVTGTVVSSNVTYAKTHTLGMAPSYIAVTPLFAAGDLVATSATAGVCGESRASAATATNFYVRGNKSGMKFRALLLG